MRIHCFSVPLNVGMEVDMEQNALLDINDLFIKYNTDDAVVYAVNGANLRLNRGETLGLVGETGAGKTTMALGILRLLAKGVGEITKGSIHFDNVDLLSLNPKKMLGYRGKKISMIFQDPMTSLNPVISIGKQIAEILKLHNDEGLSRMQIEEKVDEMLTMVGIPISRKDDYPHQFSGGMKQRVVIAISLACRPMLLIADEPTTALDVTIQAQVLSLMTDLKSTYDTAMLLITHDFGVVAEMCDKVAVMYAGRIIENGSAEDIFSSEIHHPYTEGLFNSIPDLDNDKPRLSPIAGLMPDPTNLPKGCSFHTRCSWCTDICKVEQPDEVFFGEHMIRCHRWRERE